MFGSQNFAAGGNQDLLRNLGIDQSALDPTQGGPQGGIQDALKLLKQIAEQLQIDPQSGGAQGGGGAQQGGGPQQAGGAGNSGGAASGGHAGDLEELLRKLREMAQNNPQALNQALGQVPGLTQALNGAMMGSGGGTAGAGMIG